LSAVASWAVLGRGGSARAPVGCGRHPSSTRTAGAERRPRAGREYPASPRLAESRRATGGGRVDVAPAKCRVRTGPTCGNLAMHRHGGSRPTRFA
jgi:hypothetical protein